MGISKFGSRAMDELVFAKPGMAKSNAAIKNAQRGSLASIFHLPRTFQQRTLLVIWRAGTHSQEFI